MVVYRMCTQSKSIKVWMKQIKNNFSIMGERQEHETRLVRLHFLRNSEANTVPWYYSFNMGHLLYNTVLPTFTLDFPV